MWQIILLAVILYLLGILVWLFRTFDELMRREYDAHRPMWEKDGMPRGVFWRAPEIQNPFRFNLKEEWAFERINLVWLFSTPGWMKEDALALRLVHRLRKLALLWNASLIIPVLILMVAID